METIKLSIYETIGTQNCVLPEDGEKVFAQLREALKENKKITISFANISLITSSFLNTAIGQLYGEFNEEQIKSLLSVECMEDDDKAILKRVTTNAKMFYSNPQRFEESIREILEKQ